jgi:hypothetical protein
MANLNALIAQGYQFQPPVNPFVQYGQMQQLEQGQQTNELNRMKMQEFQRGMEETNALRRLDPASPTYLQDVTRISPEKGFAFAKSQQEAKTARTEGQTKEVKLLTDKLSLLPQAYQMADTPEAYLALHQSVHADPVLGPWLKSTGATPEKGLATLENAVQTGKFDDLRLKSMQSVSQLLDSMKPLTVAASSSVYNPREGTFIQAPATPDKPKVTDLMANYQAAKDQGFTGSIFDYERKLKEAGRTPAQAPAPTITQIVDPTNPNQMITVDARRYQGGGVGSAGVLGVGGKEPGAALRMNKVEEGKTQLANDLENLRSSFTELDRLRAIPSTERNVASNLMAAAQATGVGQALGRAGGTKEQVERDVINSARQRLVASIKNATGMSAKSLDSNMELQTMLRSISDPGQSVEAALRIIGDIEDAYVKGSGQLPKSGRVAPAAQGTGGFKYLGKEGG